MNLKFLNCTQDSTLEECENDETVAKKTEQSLSKYQNKNISIFDNFFASSSYAAKDAPAKAIRTDSNKSKPQPQRPEPQALPDKPKEPKEPKKLGIENEHVIENQLNSSTPSKVNSINPVNSMSVTPPPSVPVKPIQPAAPSPKSPAVKGVPAPVVIPAAIAGNITSSEPKKQSPSNSVITISTPTQAPVMPQPAAPLPKSPAVNGVTAPVVTPPTIPGNITSPEPKKPSPSNIVSTVSTPIQAPVMPQPAAPKTNASSPILAAPAGEVKTSSLVPAIAKIPTQNFVRPKDIATGAVAFFYEEQPEEDVILKAPVNNQNKKMQLVAAAPDNKQIVLTEEKDKNAASKGWQETLINAKTSVSGYFSGIQEKIKNVFKH